MTDAPTPGVAARVLILFVRFYQLFFSWLFGGYCRFTPSCSQYAIGCLQNLGALQGALHAARRVSKCHPFHPGGYDPPPPAPTPPLSRPPSA